MPCSDKTRANGFELKEGRFRLNEHKEENFYEKGGEALEQVAQKLWMPRHWKNARSGWMRL